VLKRAISRNCVIIDLLHGMWVYENKVLKNDVRKATYKINTGSYMGSDFVSFV
jgi:hypothetical protein